MGGKLLGAPVAGAMHAFFIVATNGNDSWSGNRSVANTARTDGPLATLSHALAAARAWKQSPGTPSNAVAAIFARSGTYFLIEPLVLKPEDSGFVLSSYGTEKPVLSGGRRITGWRAAEVNGKTAWMAEVPEARGGKWRFQELWVNGRRATRARYPAHGYLNIAEVPDQAPKANSVTWKFRFRPDELKPWPTATNAEAVVMNVWIDSHLPVASVDPAVRSIQFRKHSRFQLHPGDLYYLEGALEFLDEPGEWCLDSSRGVLYYLPRPGETLQTVEAVAPALTQVLRLEGHPENGRMVDHVRVKGLTFSHTEWHYPGSKDKLVNQTLDPKLDSEQGGVGQSSVVVPGAVWGEGARGCSWKKCSFVHLGTYGLELARGCSSNLISHCEFSDLGAGGVKLGEGVIRNSTAEQTGDNELSDCHIYDGGKRFHSAVGVWLGQTPNNRVVHNLIHDFYSTGASLGWTWGYGASLCTNNLFAFNHIHHIGARSDGDGPILSDMGGIYTLGKQPGTKILNNLVHDVAALRYGGWGIYLDEGSSGILIESNIVYRTTHGGFEFHYGATNGVLNNIFAFGRNIQLNRTTPEQHLSFLFMRNLVYFDSGVLLGEDWTPHQYRMDMNLYLDTRLRADPTRFRFGNATLKEWQAMGNDRGSIIGDPLFRAPLEGDFQLASNSPAFRLYFQPIDISQVGVRK